MTTTEKIEFAKDAVGNVPAHHSCAFVNGSALRNLYAEREPSFLFNLAVNGAPTPLVVPNSTSHIFNYIRTEDASEFLAIRAALEIAEASPAFREACEIMEPLLAEVRRLEQQLADEIAEHGVKCNALQVAESAALEKAKAIADKDPAVVAARQALEKFSGPLIRGKQTLATTAE